MPSFRRSEFVEVAAGLQYPEGPVSLRDGSLVAVDVMAGSLLHIEPDPERPGRFLPPKSIVLGGSPNGAAVGPDGAIYVCNSGGFDFETLPLPAAKPSWNLNIPSLQPAAYSGGHIDRVVLEDATFQIWCAADSVAPQPDPPVKCCGVPIVNDPRGLRGPDDLVFDSQGGLWFTDWGKQQPWSRDVTGVYYLPPGSRNPVLKIPGRFSPNGIALSPRQDRLYVAETIPRWIVYWDLDGPGVTRCNLNPPNRPGFPLRTLDGAHLLTAAIPGAGQLDSMSMDEEGNLYAATMLPDGLDPLATGGITVISPRGEILDYIELDIGPPEPLPSNICFGGPDRKTAFITMAGTGRIVSCRMAVPGLGRAFEK